MTRGGGEKDDKKKFYKEVELPYSKPDESLREF